MKVNQVLALHHAVLLQCGKVGAHRCGNMGTDIRHYVAIPDIDLHLVQHITHCQAPFRKLYDSSDVTVARDQRILYWRCRQSISSLRPLHVVMDDCSGLLNPAPQEPIVNTSFVVFPPPFRRAAKNHNMGDLSLKMRLVRCHRSASSNASILFWRYSLSNFKVQDISPAVLSNWL